jgi:hypothetical protein
VEVDRLFNKKKGVQLWILMNLAMWWRTYIAAPQPAEVDN